jgi:hypothetical protein
MLERFFKKTSPFVIKSIDSTKKVAVVEDKELGLVIEVPYGPSILKKAEIISEYEIQFLYEDGSSRISKILMKCCSKITHLIGLNSLTGLKPGT